MILLHQDGIVGCGVRWRWIWCVRCGRSWRQSDVLLWWCLLSMTKGRKKSCLWLAHIWTYRAGLWPSCIIVNHSIASRHRHRCFDVCLSRWWHQQSLANVPYNLPLIFGIFMWRSSHVAMAQCRWQWWRRVGSIHFYGFVFIIQISVVEVFIIVAFWSENEQRISSVNNHSI